MVMDIILILMDLIGGNMTPYQYINKHGIPTIKSTSVTIGTDAVTFNFNADTSYGNPFRGLLLVYLANTITSGTTTTLPIKFSSAAGTKNVTTNSGVNWTVADVGGEGVYLFYYDRVADVLQIIN